MFDTFPTASLERSLVQIGKMNDELHIPALVQTCALRWAGGVPKGLQYMEKNKSYVRVGLLGQPILGRPHEKCVFY